MDIENLMIDCSGCLLLGEDDDCNDALDALTHYILHPPPDEERTPREQDFYWQVFNRTLDALPEEKLNEHYQMAKSLDHLEEPKPNKQKNVVMIKKVKAHSVVAP
jgi:hypothetical protein